MSKGFEFSEIKDGMLHPLDWQANASPLHHAGQAIDGAAAAAALTVAARLALRAPASRVAAELFGDSDNATGSRFTSRLSAAFGRSADPPVSATMMDPGSWRARRLERQLADDPIDRQLAELKARMVRQGMDPSGLGLGATGHQAIADSTAGVPRMTAAYRAPQAASQGPASLDVERELARLKAEVASGAYVDPVEQRLALLKAEMGLGGDTARAGSAAGSPLELAQPRVDRAKLHEIARTTGSPVDNVRNYSLDPWSHPGAIRETWQTGAGRDTITHQLTTTPEGSVHEIARPHPLHPDTQIVERLDKIPGSITGSFDHRTMSGRIEAGPYEHGRTVTHSAPNGQLESYFGFDGSGNVRATHYQLDPGGKLVRTTVMGPGYQQSIDATTA